MTNAEINPQNVEELCKEEDLISLFHDYENERSQLRKGTKGYLAQFWIQHLDRLWLVLNLIISLKENDFNLYKKTLKSMIPLFFIMNHQNYARYLTAYVAGLEQIEHSHPEASHHLKNCALSVTRGVYPASGTAVDQTIEQTINRHAKSDGGIIGFSRNLQAYDRWVLTRHERALYAATLFGLAGING